MTSDAAAGLHAAGGVGGLLATHDEPGGGQPTRDFVHFYDANGNVTQLIDISSGAAAAKYEYDAFGNELVRTGTFATSNRFRFSTKYTDANTDFAGEGTDGLSYYGFRYYSPRLGRWMNRDPIGEAGGLNAYGFVGNNPVNAVDLLGLCEFCAARAYLCTGFWPRFNPGQHLGAELEGSFVRGAACGAARGTCTVVQSGCNAACELLFITADAVSYPVDTFATALGSPSGYEPYSQLFQQIDDAGPDCFEVGRELGGEFFKDGATLGIYSLYNDLREYQRTGDCDEFGRRQGGKCLIVVMCGVGKGMSAPRLAPIAEGQVPVTGYTWYQEFQARYGPGNVDWKIGSLPDLPVWVEGAPCVGVLRSPCGDIGLQSGIGPATLARPGSRGLNGLVRQHVEGHACALMLDEGIRDAVLFLNKTPCRVINGCSQNLPRMVPPGCRLRVIVPNQYDQLFLGPE